MTWRRSDLRPYQRFFVRKIGECFHPNPRKRLPGLVLALEPGAGKTGTTLTALKDLHDSLTIRRTLIVAPLLVAQTVWPAEMEEWEHLKTLTWTLIRVEEDDPETTAAGQAAYDETLARCQAEVEEHRIANLLLDASKQKARADSRKATVRPSTVAEEARKSAVAKAKEAKLARLVATDTEIHIINKEALPWLWEHLGRGSRWHYDALVIDDVREAKSGKKRSKSKVVDGKKLPAPISRFGIMSAIRQHVIATIQLTGTPTPLGLHNMWGLIYPIDLGRRLGETKTPFFRKHFYLDKMFHTPLGPKEGAFDAIMDKVKDIMFSLNPKDLPQLPPYIIDPIRVKLDPPVLAEYRRFERELVSEEYDVEAASQGVMHGKKLQFANGSMYQEDGNDIWIHDAKLDALKLLVERLNGTPLLVAYTYQFDVERIMGAFPDAVLLRPENAAETMKLWNQDKIPILLAHRASAGHGLNAQKGTGHMCEYGLTTDAELYLQFLKRIWRSGRKTTVFNHVIIAEGTIDEDVFVDYLDPKIATQIRVMQSVEAPLFASE